MKKVYDEYLCLPKEGKIKEKVFMTRVILSIAVMVLCLGAMGFTAYAYFTCTISSGSASIKSASYKFDVEVTDVTETDFTPNAEGYFIFDNLATEENPDVTDKYYEFAITLSEDSTASVGYGKFEVVTDVNETAISSDSRQLYYTTPIGTYMKEGETVTQKEYKLNLCVPAGKTVKVKVIAEWGTCARGPAMTTGTTLTPDFVDSKYVHIGIDDVSNSLLRLNNTEYTSLYDEPFFAWLKTLHDSYGAKFSLYAYVNVLEQVPDNYQAEFAEAKDWLKIGLHAEDAASNYAGLDYETGKTVWNRFAENVFRITGTYESIDRMPKLEGSAGSEEVLKGMKEAVSEAGDKYGALGFLAENTQTDGTSDTTQLQGVYYLNAEEDADALNTLFCEDFYIDKFDATTTAAETESDDSLNGLVFVSTDIIFGNLDADDTKRQEQYQTATSMHSCIAVLHEGQLYDENGFIADAEGNTELLKSQVEEFCKYANDKGIKFNYSQTRDFEAIQALKDAEKAAQEAAEKAAQEAAEQATQEAATGETAGTTEDTTTGTSQESADNANQEKEDNASQDAADSEQEEEEDAEDTMSQTPTSE